MPPTGRPSSNRGPSAPGAAITNGEPTANRQRSEARGETLEPRIAAEKRRRPSAQVRARGACPGRDNDPAPEPDSNPDQRDSHAAKNAARARTRGSGLGPSGEIGRGSPVSTFYDVSFCTSQNRYFPYFIAAKARQSMTKTALRVVPPRAKYGK